MLEVQPLHALTGTDALVLGAAELDAEGLGVGASGSLGASGGGGGA